VSSVAYSPDGARILSGGGELNKPGELKVWDAGAGPDLLWLKGHTDAVLSVAYSPDGKRVFGSNSKGKVLAWDAVTGHLLPDPPAHIPAGRTSAVHGNRRAVAVGPLVRVERILTAEEQQRPGEQEQRTQRILDARARIEFHSDQAETAEANHQPFAAVFHLDRLLPLLPEQRARLLERRHAVLTAVLQKTPGDPWASRALARQAVSDPDGMSFRVLRRAVLPHLAKQQDAPHDRLYGALLLRTGSRREAVLVLRAAIRSRAPDAPPVEELLLALAHARLKQPAEARKHLQTAVAWMQRGSEPVRAASLSGLAVRSPLTALAGLAVTPPDPRLVPLDAQTAHELTALRSEVEKALAHHKP
jgi:hypothetical protein